MAPSIHVKEHLSFLAFDCHRNLLNENELLKREISETTDDKKKCVLEARKKFNDGELKLAKEAMDFVNNLPISPC